MQRRKTFHGRVTKMIKKGRALFIYSRDCHSAHHLQVYIILSPHELIKKSIFLLNSY